MEDLLTLIESGMKDLILGMRKSGGYFFDWQTVNESDASRQTSPSAEIFLENEECQDEEDAAWAGGYNQHAMYTIRVRFVMENESENPLFDVNTELNKALHDLKKLFGTTYSMPDTCSTIMYKGMERIRNTNNDIMRPAYMDTDWLIKYTQDRTHPVKISN